MTVPLLLTSQRWWISPNTTKTLGKDLKIRSILCSQVRVYRVLELLKITFREWRRQEKRENWLNICRILENIEMINLTQKAPVEASLKEDRTYNYLVFIIHKFYLKLRTEDRQHHLLVLSHNLKFPRKRIYSNLN